MKNNTNSGESRDGKKHKISAMRDTYISLCHLRFGRCHVTKPLFGNCNRMMFKLMVNFKPGDTWETIFFISDTGSSEEKIWVEPVNSPNVSRLVIGQTPSCCENSNFLFRITCVIIKHSFSQNNSASPKAKIPVRSGVRSDPQSDPILVLLTAPTRPFPS